MLAVSWPWLVSPPPGDDGIFTERVGRMEWDQRAARRPGSCISHACARTSVFLTYDVFGGAHERPNIFLTDFLSAAFFKLCIWFIPSWMKRSFQCECMRVMTNLSFRQKHWKSFKTLLNLIRYFKKRMTLYFNHVLNSKLIVLTFSGINVTCWLKNTHHAMFTASNAFSVWLLLLGRSQILKHWFIRPLGKSP